MSIQPGTRRFLKMGVAILAVVGVVVGYGWLRGQRFELSMNKPEFTTVTRGDLTIPITPSGVVLPSSAGRVEIKSKASGEMIALGADPDDPNRVGTFLFEGDPVKTGDLLVRLDPVDERRNVEYANADAQQARAAWRRAIIDAEQSAPANVEGARAAHDLAVWELEQVTGKQKRGAASEREVERIATQVRNAKASLDLTLARAEQAKEDVHRFEATFQQAKTRLGEAQQRLEETTIYSPIDGQITRINTRVGEVIQGGMTTITGGSVLMVVTDVSELYVVAQVDEADIGRVRELVDTSQGDPTTTLPAGLLPTGSAVTVTVDAFQDETFTGRIMRLKPEPKKSSYVTTYDVEILLTSPNSHKLMIGMDASVSFTAQTVHDVLLLSRDAFKSLDDKVGVYVPVADDGGTEIPEFRMVKRGLTDGLYTQVMSGLQEGDRVYTKLPASPNQDDTENKD